MTRSIHSGDLALAGETWHAPAAALTLAQPTGTSSFRAPLIAMRRPRIRSPHPCPLR